MTEGHAAEPKRLLTVDELCLKAAGGDPEKAKRVQLIVNGRGQVDRGFRIYDEPVRPEDRVKIANRKMRRSMAKQRRQGKL